MGMHSHPSACSLQPPIPTVAPESKPKVFLALSSGHCDLTSVYSLVTNFLGVKADLIQIRMLTLHQLFGSLFFVAAASSFQPICHGKTVQSKFVFVPTRCTSGPIGANLFHVEFWLILVPQKSTRQRQIYMYCTPSCTDFVQKILVEDIVKIKSDQFLTDDTVICSTLLCKKLSASINT